MKNRIRTVVTLFLFAALTLPAEPPKAGPEHDFDYLLGDWEFTAVSKQWGTFHGTWSAVELEEGQILDEYRVLGDDDQTIYVTTTLRNYNERAGRWDLVGADAGRGLQDVGWAKRAGSEMHIEQRFGVTSDEPSLWRIRYYEIGRDRFLWAADRSLDDGKTWVKDHQTIEARRIGPARRLSALSAKKLSKRAAPGK